LARAEKKVQLETIASLLVNFIIYFWIGKILLNMPVFWQSPLAVLAYPGQSSAFYMAVAFSVIHIFIKQKRQKIDVQEMMYTLMHVFLFASFTYEFIQLIRMTDHGVWDYLYLGLLLLLIVSVVLLDKRAGRQQLVYGVLAGWSFGQLLLSLSAPYTTVFGYLMAPWFLSILFVT